MKSSVNKKKEVKFDLVNIEKNKMKKKEMIHATGGWFPIIPICGCTAPRGNNGSIHGGIRP